MDRRTQKTKKAIFSAFSTLLSQKRYYNITVQEIIDEANIGRSTFYSHFETKDELLHAMCTELFEHIFSDKLSQETLHDFSGRTYTLKERMEHVFCHLYEDKTEILRILSYESGDLFLYYFKQYLPQLFKQTVSEMRLPVPQGFLMNHMVGSFAEAVKWWAAEDMKTPPEKLAQYLFSTYSCVS